MCRIAPAFDSFSSAVHNFLSPPLPPPGLRSNRSKDGLLLKEFGSPKQVLAVRGPLDEQYRTLRFLDLRADVS